MITQCKLGKLPIAQWVRTFYIGGFWHYPVYDYSVHTGYEDFVSASVHWLRGFCISQCTLGKLPIAQWVRTFYISQCALAMRILH